MSRNNPVNHLAFICRTDQAIVEALIRITEAMRIGSLASAFNLRLAPHLWAGAPCFFAGLHVCAAAPSSFTVEFSLGANPMIHELSKNPVEVKDGLIAIPDTPGIGLDMNEAVIRKFAKKE